MSKQLMTKLLLFCSDFAFVNIYLKTKDILGENQIYIHLNGEVKLRNWRVAGKKETWVAPP